MLSNANYISKSLELHLFFARIMKEHALFLQVSFTPRDANYIRQADAFRRGFDFLLAEVITVSNGLVSPEVIQSGEILTPYTLKAEMITSFFTGVNIETGITKVEAGLRGGQITTIMPMAEQTVRVLNERAMALLRDLIEFKSNVLSRVNACDMFTTNYPSLIEHVLHEAQFYYQMVQRLQAREDVDVDREAYEQEKFWNHIMGDHAKTIRGLLDPTEDNLINIANNFAKIFEQLEHETRMDTSMPMESENETSDITDDSLKAAKALRNFKVQATQGILECKIKSIIIPLLSDHVLRENNHYLRLLNTYENNK